MKNDKDINKFKRLIKEGHSQLCACHQTWSSSNKCECGKSTDRHLTPAAPDSEGRTVLESSSIPGDEETFNNGSGW